MLSLLRVLLAYYFSLRLWCISYIGGLMTNSGFTICCLIVTLNLNYSVLSDSILAIFGIIYIFSDGNGYLCAMVSGPVSMFCRKLQTMSEEFAVNLAYTIIQADLVLDYRQN